MADNAIWIYQERQQSALCGMHALNNLCQGALFSETSLRKVANELDRMELAMYGPPGSAAYNARLREGSGNVDGYGNFSLQVLQRALGTFSTDAIELPNIVDDRIKNIEPTTFEGFICHREAHWFTIRKIKDRYWNLNSFMKKPETISHFKLAAEIANLRNKAYTVFVALPNNWENGGKLPPICESRRDLGRGKMKYWWNADILLEDERKLGHKGNINYADKADWSFDKEDQTVIQDHANATQDPWKDVGNGQSIGRKNNDAARTNVVPLEQYESLEVDTNAKSVPDGAKMQLRLPQNKKHILILPKDRTVGHVYKAAFSLCQSKPPGKVLQLSTGHPPKVMADGDISIKDAKLAGTMIQCRWI